MTEEFGHNPYSFDAFLEARSQHDFYRDNAFLHQLVRKYVQPRAVGDAVHERLLAFSRTLSTRWNRLADEICRIDVRPYLQHFDAHNHRIDRIVRPLEVQILEREVFDSGLFRTNMNPWESYVERLLLSELGDAGLNCPIACTDGLVALLRTFADDSRPELMEILQHCTDGANGECAIGAQFMSEIQGGSNIPANVVTAVPEDGYYRLYGNKFFCSATHADYAVVTARVHETNHVATFIVPAYMPEDKAMGKRNGYQIQRLKQKMGTCELPTAEIQYEGAVAYQLGPIDKGVATAVGIVLTLSRVAIGAASAGYMFRAVQEASLYANFRDVFGRSIVDYPLVARQLREMETIAQRTAAAAFAIFDMYTDLGIGVSNFGEQAQEEGERKKKRLRFRELVLLQKITSAKDAVDVLHTAISILGGHGIMEDFTVLPRLFRDAAINELWEGPRNLLLTQIYKDLQKAKAWYAPAEFVRDLLPGWDPVAIERLGQRLEYLLKKPVVGEISDESVEAAREWDAFCNDLFHTYQECVRSSVEHQIRQV